MDLKAITVAVSEGSELDATQASAVAKALADPAVAATDKEAFLEALSKRGETPGEIEAFARTFRELARDPGLDEWAPDAIDVCGTGGDKSGTFNVSTTVAFILAAAGVPVIKHGNRSITSKSGSADLLELLGIRLDADADTLKRSMSALNFVFLFAPGYHPAFKEIVPVRKALAARGVRTIFNLLGPLLNPARPAHQIMGVFSETFVPAVAGALGGLELKAGFAVHCVGKDGGAYDELTVAGRNRAVGFGDLAKTDLSFEAGDVGLPDGLAAELKGGEASDNVEILNNLIKGTAPAALRNTVTLNAGAAFHAVGRAASIEDGITVATDVLQSGKLGAWLEIARKFYQQ
jgi:anthranilate phosphoribosyltransferase